MSEETRKVEQIEQERKASELSEQDLDNVAGGGGGAKAYVPVHTGPVTPGKVPPQPKHGNPPPVGGGLESI